MAWLVLRHVAGQRSPEATWSLGLTRLVLREAGSPAVSCSCECARQQPASSSSAVTTVGRSSLLDVQAVNSAEMPELIGCTHIPLPELKSSCFFKSWNCLKSFYIYWVWVFVLSDISCFLALANKQTRTGYSYM